jgi:ubiquinone/menaquinone biosynthesis C-methylase UbiE
MAKYEEWRHPNAVDFYAKHRHQVSDLYPSERVFLPTVLSPGVDVLDIGCASGGFFNIMRSLQPGIRYTGIDISPTAIQIARQRYPEARFEVADATAIPFRDNAFDFVHCTGVTVHVPLYQDVIREAYRVSRRYVIMDMRLFEGAVPNLNKEESYLRIAFNGIETGERAHYIVADPTAEVGFMLGLRPRLRRLSATGYFHAVSPMAHTHVKEVCMTIFLMEKGDSLTSQTEANLSDLPIKITLSGLNPPQSTAPR